MIKDTITLAKYLYTKGIDSSLKIQKILFFLRYEELNNNKSFGFFKPENNFQAWIYGPVNYESFVEMQKLFSSFEEKEVFFLTEEDVKEIDSMYGEWFKKYENYSPSTLVEMSHKNLSWINARADLDIDMPCRTFLKEDRTFIEFKK